jgi:hypothetical protein
MSVKLTKDKKVISDYYGDSGEVDAKDILKVAFIDPVTEIDGWTLEDIFDLVYPLKEIWSGLAWCDFEAFYSELKSDITMLKPDDIEHISKIDYIKIYRVLELDDDGFVTESFHMSGIGKEDRYAMGYSPLNSIKNLKIVASDDFEINKLYSMDPPLFKAKKPLCLLEIIWAILWEISFHGAPGDRDEFVEELGRRVESIKDGTAKLIPAAQVFKELKERFNLPKEEDK